MMRLTLFGKVSSVPESISSDPVVLDAGKELMFDRRALPVRKEIAIECECGGVTHPFIILRDFSAYEAEKNDLGSNFGSRAGYLRLASLYSRIYLQGFCKQCGQRIEANIKLDH